MAWWRRHHHHHGLRLATSLSTRCGTTMLSLLAHHYSTVSFDDPLHQHLIDDIIPSVNTLKECITAIGQWMSANRLKLNAEKTELMWAGTRYRVANLLCDHDLSLTLGANIIKATDVISTSDSFSRFLALYQFVCMYVCMYMLCLQCFDAVGWAAGRASGL